MLTSTGIARSAAAALSDGGTAKDRAAALPGAFKRFDAILHVIELVLRDMPNADPAMRIALQRLTEALAKIVNLTPQPDETLRDFTKRLAAFMEGLPQPAQALIEKQLGQQSLITALKLLIETLKPSIEIHLPHLTLDAGLGERGIRDGGLRQEDLADDEPSYRPQPTIQAPLPTAPLRSHPSTVVSGAPELQRALELAFAPGEPSASVAPQAAQGSLDGMPATGTEGPEAAGYEDGAGPAPLGQEPLDGFLEARTYVAMDARALAQAVAIVEGHAPDGPADAAILEAATDDTPDPQAPRMPTSPVPGARPPQPLQAEASGLPLAATGAATGIDEAPSPPSTQVASAPRAAVAQLDRGMDGVQEPFSKDAPAAFVVSTLATTPAAEIALPDDPQRGKAPAAPVTVHGAGPPSPRQDAITEEHYAQTAPHVGPQPIAQEGATADNRSTAPEKPAAIRREAQPGAVMAPPNHPETAIAPPVRHVQTAAIVIASPEAEAPERAPSVPLLQAQMRTQTQTQTQTQTRSMPSTLTRDQAETYTSRPPAAFSMPAVPRADAQTAVPASLRQDRREAGSPARSWQAQTDMGPALSQARTRDPAAAFSAERPGREPPRSLPDHVGQNPDRVGAAPVAASKPMAAAETIALPPQARPEAAPNGPLRETPARTTSPAPAMASPVNARSEPPPEPNRGETMPAAPQRQTPSVMSQQQAPPQTATVAAPSQPELLHAAPAQRQAPPMFAPATPLQHAATTSAVAPLQLQQQQHAPSLTIVPPRPNRMDSLVALPSKPDHPRLDHSATRPPSPEISRAETEEGIAKAPPLRTETAQVHAAPIVSSVPMGAVPDVATLIAQLDEWDMLFYMLSGSRTETFEETANPPASLSNEEDAAPHEAQTEPDEDSPIADMETLGLASAAADDAHAAGGRPYGSMPSAPPALPLALPTDAATLAVRDAIAFAFTYPLTPARLVDGFDEDEPGRGDLSGGGRDEDGEAEEDEPDREGQAKDGAGRERNDDGPESEAGGMDAYDLYRRLSGLT